METDLAMMSVITDDAMESVHVDPVELTVLCDENQVPAVEEEAVHRQRHGREREVDVLGSILGSGRSIAEAARTYDVPESTVRHWLRRALSAEAPAEVIAFFESPAGLWTLHRIVLAAEYTVSFLAGGGVRASVAFLRLSGLHHFVASSYGSTHGAVATMEEHVAAFGAAEHTRLSAAMEQREISVLLDETFHNGTPCMVAIEAASNYILCEEYAEDRTAETWQRVLDVAQTELPVVVVQWVSDEGSSLLKLAKDNNGHHSPDLFHPHQDISRATSLALQRKQTAAESAQQAAKTALDEIEQEAKSYAETVRGPGRRRDYSGRIEEARQELEYATAEAEQAKKDRQLVRDKALALSEVYHPYDLKDGSVRDADLVEAELEDTFEALEALVDAAVALSQNQWRKLRKAKKLISSMAATIAFVHEKVSTAVDALKHDAVLAELITTALIPAYYLMLVARRCRDKEERPRLQTLAQTLYDKFHQHPLVQQMPEMDQRAMATVAQHCAHLFQRSSSAVEGRNGTLRLKHHSHHLLSTRKLNAHTVIHNFATKRPDGTTPAERFFGQKPRSLFEYLIAQMPPPKRPAKKRPRKSQ